MADLLRATGGLFLTMTIGTFIVGFLLAVLGIVLVYLGSSGDTEFSFFGQTFKSTNVGIAAIFLGAAVIVLNIRSINKSTAGVAHSESVDGR